MTEEILEKDKTEQLEARGFVNVQDVNNNLALDEFVEILNRDSKTTCSGFQTNESIIALSQEFPNLINTAKYFDHMFGITARKGFHHLPSYIAINQSIMISFYGLSTFDFEI